MTLAQVMRKEPSVLTRLIHHAGMEPELAIGSVWRTCLFHVVSAEDLCRWLPCRRRLHRGLSQGSDSGNATGPGRHKRAHFGQTVETQLMWGLQDGSEKHQDKQW